MGRLCKRGHLITEENSYKNKGRMVCKTCAIERVKSKYVIKRKPVVEHLASKSLLTENGCMEFQGRRSDQGYGFYKRVEGASLAHRAAWILKNGPIPEGLCICHTCDNPPCINVDHLFLGTRGDNNKDRALKGRSVTPNMNLTHCKRGHEFNETNTTIRKIGTRLCRVCNNMKSLERFHKIPKVKKKRKLKTLKTVCKRGHEFIDSNTYIRPDGFRSCKECQRIRTNG